MQLRYSIFISPMYPLRADIQGHGRLALSSLSWYPAVHLLTSRCLVTMCMATLTSADQTCQRQSYIYLQPPFQGTLISLPCCSMTTDHAQKGDMCSVAGQTSPASMQTTSTADLDNPYL